MLEERDITLPQYNRARSESSEMPDLSSPSYCCLFCRVQGQPDQPPPVPEATATSASLETPEGYRALTGEGAIAEYLAGLPK